MFCYEHLLSQYLVEPRRVHLVAAKHVMRYLKGTLDFGLFQLLAMDNDIDDEKNLR